MQDRTNLKVHNLYRNRFERNRSDFVICTINFSKPYVMSASYSTIDQISSVNQISYYC